MKLKTRKLDIKKDERGWLAEIISTKDVDGEKFGLLGITTAHPGQTKGRHFHKRKREWYCVIRGQGLLTVVDNKTKKKQELELGEKNMVLVEIPRNCLHWIKNIGKDEMHLLFYTNEAFDPEDPDTFYEK